MAHGSSGESEVHRNAFQLRLLQGLKPTIDLIGFMRGLNPPPPSDLSFSAACEVVPWLQGVPFGAGFAPDVAAIWIATFVLDTV
jgi:hypothetical protein